MINYTNSDTIIALATPPGRGGISIIRMSGTLILKIIPKLFKTIPKPRHATYSSLLSQDGSILEKVIIIFFPKPFSFTGENVLEIHGHGGQMIVDLLLKRILEISDHIRIARPGEFTERAFLNNKIDLIQAEAIADIINATSEQAAKCASNSLQGIFSNKIKIILKKINTLRTNIEYSIDFSEETNNFFSYKTIKNNLQDIIHDVKKIYQSACHGVVLKEGMKIVIAGKPNSGKSSLFNALIGNNRAIVSEISGTTRDTLHEDIQLSGINFYITDTAGLKENANNQIEKIGIQKAKDELKNANHILWVIDSYKNNNIDYCLLLSNIQKILNKNQNTPITIIQNKSDLSQNKIGIQIIQNKYTIISISALLNQGINHLKKYLINNFESFNKNISKKKQDNFIARRRHLNILRKTLKYLYLAQSKFIECYDDNQNNKKIILHDELYAEDIKLAYQELNKIFGKYATNDDLLKKIFSEFCIGK